MSLLRGIEQRLASLPPDKRGVVYAGTGMVVSVVLFVPCVGGGLEVAHRLSESLPQVSPRALEWAGFLAGHGVCLGLPAGLAVGLERRITKTNR